ncbi:uncharacterized protein GGS22DRAFT_78531 [Annulohypoxylon maeteangense]|uniref:uncharacterized protein n=1 Tax=Annulohypoxylon maeteangense TaxID=1927788 RepID=UPI002007EB6D|nr:uncharacterized protein GGS22DRAFT_78531 [Annulohypoxylon maeteangense]KAI0880978.1 hypothetical protein GGS22DRAFT_78531 [Annulohypoxylon maeteangense]
MYGISTHYDCVCVCVCVFLLRFWYSIRGLSGDRVVRSPFFCVVYLMRLQKEGGLSRIARVFLGIVFNERYY